MIQNKKSGKRIARGMLLTLLAAALVTTGVMSGCGGKSKATPDEASGDTQSATRVANGVYVDENGNVVTDPNGSAIAATDSASSKAQASAQQSGAAGDNSGSKNAGNSNAGNNGGSESKSSSSGNSGSKQTSSAGSAIDNSKRTPTPSNAKEGNTEKKSNPDTSAKDLTIGGKHYNVGDKVVCTYFLMVPDQILNFQGTVEYDSSLLKKTDASLVEPANYSSIVNQNVDGRVLFNGSMLSGYDFTDPGYEFLVVEYEVLKTGTAEPAINFEVLSDTSDKVYSGSNGVLSNGAKVWAVYS